MKRIAAVLLAGLGLMTSMVVAGPAASAETNAPRLYASCEGRLVATSPIHNANGTRISTLKVWESGSGRSATMCAKNVHYGDFKGKTMWTTVRLRGTYDRGHYSQYAGAVRVDGLWDGVESVVHGGSDPSNDRQYCVKAYGNTAGHSATIWLCTNTIISR